MRNLVMFVSLALLLSVTISGCGTTKQPVPPPPQKPETVQLPPEVQEVRIYPTIPKQDLVCSREPSVPVNIKTDTDGADLYQQLRDAWADCFGKLNTLNELVATWPKAPPP